MTTYRVLITGAGSLVAKGILDSLEGRRQSLCLIGAGFGDPTPTMLRCDEFVRTVSSDHPDFGRQLRRIVSESDVDLVIPGRDFDVPVVAALDVASLTGDGAQIGTDKWLTYQFAISRGLPIVPTALPGTADFGPPAVRKPRIGGGSLGVMLLLTEPELERAQRASGIVLQPLLGPVPDLDLTEGRRCSGRHRSRGREGCRGLSVQMVKLALRRRSRPNIGSDGSRSSALPRTLNCSGWEWTTWQRWRRKGGAVR